MNGFQSQKMSVMEKRKGDNGLDLAMAIDGFEKRYKEINQKGAIPTVLHDHGTHICLLVRFCMSFSNFFPNKSFICKIISQTFADISAFFMRFKFNGI